MPCPHNEITIVQRSQRQSAVAAAAYQSGEKLFCEYDQQVKHYPEKRGIVHNEILLPANAPQEYADRNTLWNAAEAVEKQWNSQLARRWVLTIPREIPPDQYAVLVREFCEQQFVSKGMIADFAIHDPHPPGHNPHAHVMLTMRAMDEHGKWLPKSRKVYDLDESGERIKLPSGRWKSHKEDEMHLLLKEEQTAAYSVEIWKRFRKWGGIPTGLTQNVKDLLSSREVENIFENSDMIIMLNQAAGDRQILAKQLNISPHQLSYVTHSGEGEGLLFFGNVILPFVDRFPTDLELYRIMTTKLGEVSEGAQK